MTDPYRPFPTPEDAALQRRICALFQQRIDTAAVSAAVEAERERCAQRCREIAQQHKASAESAAASGDDDCQAAHEHCAEAAHECAEAIERGTE